MLTVKTTACVWKIENGVDCTPAALPIKRSEDEGCTHPRRARNFGGAPGGNKFRSSGLPQEMHGSFTGFQQARHDPSDASKRQAARHVDGPAPRGSWPFIGC